MTQLYHVHLSDFGSVQVRNAEGLPIADIHSSPDEAVNAARVAHAHLFAAAPDLLALARRLEAICDEEREAWSGQGDEIAAGIEATWTERLADVRAVIAQATGGKAEG